MTAAAMDRFIELRRDLRELLSFRYFRDEPQAPPNVEITFGSADDSRRMVLRFGGVTRFEAQAWSGNWLLEVDDITSKGWEQISYWVTEGEGNEGENVGFYAETFEVEEHLT